MSKLASFLATVPANGASTTASAKTTDRRTAGTKKPKPTAAAQQDYDDDFPDPFELAKLDVELFPITGACDLGGGIYLGDGALSRPKLTLAAAAPCHATPCHATPYTAITTHHHSKPHHTTPRCQSSTPITSST